MKTWEKEQPICWSTSFHRWCKLDGTLQGWSSQRHHPVGNQKNSGRYIVPQGGPKLSMPVAHKGEVDSRKSTGCMFTTPWEILTGHAGFLNRCMALMQALRVDGYETGYTYNQIGLIWNFWNMKWQLYNQLNLRLGRRTMRSADGF